MLRSISHSQTALRSLTQTLISLSITCSNRLSASFSSSSRHDDEDEWMVYNRDPESPPRLFVVQPRLRPEARMKSKLSEALNLANSLEEQRDGFYGEEFSEKGLPPHLVVQNPVVRSGKSRSDTYFGPGTVDNIKCHINAIESQDGLDAVFVNAVLSGIQQRNLERAWGKPVLDRVGLIIEIFNAHAQTKEAKLQSELAALMFKRTRLVRVRGSDGRLTFGASGEAEVVSARGRGGSGGRGFTSGAGETELQLQRRRILERRSHLRSLIEEVRRTRAVQRASRRRRGGSDGQGLSTVAVVGYTNAGKSTLVNALSDSNVYCDDRLFATVDPRLRNVVLPSGKKVLLSDTVGFISDLPVQLVEAFHATLEEVVEADLLVHVLDSSAVDLEEQRSSVLEVLQQIGVPEDKLKNMIEVSNKVDLRENACEGDASTTEGEVDETHCFEEAEDETQSNLSSEESIDEDDMVKGFSPEDTVDDQQNDDLEDWKRVDDQQCNYSEGWKTEDHQQGELSANSRTIADDSHSQSEDVKRVETSAIMGIGLQELLNVIDEKLSTEKVLTRTNFERKWRPPRNIDTGMAVEQ